jgi:hypothetical protein
MKNKAKNIDIDDLIINAKNKARELMEKNLKPQRKEKSGNQTSRNSKSKKQGLLIGGAYVKLSIEVKDKLRDELGKIAPLVLLLKHTIAGKMINSFSKLDEGKINNWIRGFDIILKNLAQTTDSEGNENNIYGYDVFESRMKDDKNGIMDIDYKEYGIKKEIETLNSFKILYNLLNIKDEDDPDQGVLYYGGAFVKKNAEEIAALKDEEEQKMLKFNEDTKRADFEFKYEPLGEDFKDMSIEQKKDTLLKKEKETTQEEKNRLIRIYNAKNSEFIKNLESNVALINMLDKQKKLAVKKTEENLKRLHESTINELQIKKYKQNVNKIFKQKVINKERPRYIQEFEKNMAFAEAWFQVDKGASSQEENENKEDKEKYLDWARKEYEYQKSLYESDATNTIELNQATIDIPTEIIPDNTRKSKIVYETSEQKILREGAEAKVRRAQANALLELQKKQTAKHSERLQKGQQQSATSGSNRQQSAIISNRPQSAANRSKRPKSATSKRLPTPQIFVDTNKAKMAANMNPINDDDDGF